MPPARPTLSRFIRAEGRPSSALTAAPRINMAQTAGTGWGICRRTRKRFTRSLLSQPWETTVFSLTEKTVVLQQFFKYFVPQKALKLYKKLQKCQKLLANLDSEDTV